MPNGCCFAKYCAAKAFGVIWFKNSGQGSDGFQKYGASATRALASMHRASISCMYDWVCVWKRLFRLWSAGNKIIQPLHYQLLLKAAESVVLLSYHCS
jgi:hypothetical protein